MAESLLPQWVGEQDGRADPDEHCRAEPGEISDGVQGGLGLCLAIGEVAAQADAERGECSADALSDLAGEGKRCVVGLLWVDLRCVRLIRPRVRRTAGHSFVIRQG